jgi:aromatic ring-opening dioxygenase catalytic subunit (LigB family)
MTEKRERAPGRDKNPTRRAALVAAGGIGAASFAALHRRGGGGHGGDSTAGGAPGLAQPAASAGRMPVVFLPHGGGPWPFVELGFDKQEMAAMAAYLRELPAVPRQKAKAVLAISAHWEEPVPTVMTAARPPMLYDYYGFPPESYQITWPAPGDPALAARVRQLLGAAGIDSAEDAQRGFDHGTFVPLKLAYPDADVPTVQLSLRRGLDPQQHLEIGRALAPLRDEGVFIVGSGMTFHNLRAFGDPRARPISEEFDAWLRESAALPQGPRDGRLLDWALAPSARLAHPREEHLLPLMVVAGAAGADRGVVGYGGVAMGVRLSSYHFG